jgi:DNA-binding beta-propeller fold protein YncE
MKPIMPSNWKGQRRVLCTLLLGIATLWATPGSALAQLYVSQSTTNTVGKYDATTGAPINANFIAGLSRPLGLALSADGTALFVANNSNDTVGKYSATTGAAINANFITFLSAPLSSAPLGLALSGNGTALFVENANPTPIPSFTVGEYNAITGAPINANLIRGLGGSTELALSGDGAALFVPSTSLFTGTTIGEYNATTGAAINTNFITGLLNAIGLTLSGDGTALLVANNSSGTIGKYNATTGAAINTNFITGLNGPLGLAVSGNNLFVGGIFMPNGLPIPGTGAVGKYDATMGVAVSANFITGLNDSPLLAIAATPTPTPTAKELVWENTVTGQRSIWVMQNGVPQFVISLPTISTQWRIAAAADFLGAGQADLVWKIQLRASIVSGS